MKGGRWLKVYSTFVYFWLYLPIAVMMVFSFNNARRNVVWKGFTLSWYAHLPSNVDLMTALYNSLLLAVCSTALSVLFATLAAYALVRHPPFRGRQGYASLLNVPMMIPEVVMGVGLLLFFVRTNLPLSFGTLVAAHVVFCLPYAVGTIRARLLSLKSSSLEDAAMDLGATEWQAFCKVTLPLAWPAIFSGALLTFTMSFEDFVTSFFVAGIGTTTLPIQIYSMMKFGITPEVNALATLLLLFTIAMLGAYHWLGGSKEAAQR